MCRVPQISGRVPSDSPINRPCDPESGRQVRSIATDIFHKILIADDGSPEGERAAELGLRLAARIQAEVVLLGIVPPQNIHPTGAPEEDPSIRYRRIEKRFYDYLHLGRSLGLEITADIVEGWAEKQIRRRAKTDHVDLIILGHQKINWFQRWFVESTAETLLRRTSCSVMTAR
jgi:nucleotide-binding universal stress UspA family protein